MQNCECTSNSGSRNRRGPNKVRWASHLMLGLYLSAVLSQSIFPTSTADAFVPVTSQQRVGRQATPNKGITKERIFTSATSLCIAKSGGRMIETVDEFSEIVLAEDSPRPVLAFFSAAWCGPCRLSIPVVKEIMKQFTGKIDVVEICTDDLAETSAECGVDSIPTIQFYYRGELLDTIVGCVARSVLSSAVSKLLDDISNDAESASGKDQ